MITTGKMSVVFDEEFENIFSQISIPEFHDLGFSYGDSVNIIFDNGKTVNDIPYYSGYYSGVEELMLCGYQGDPHVKLARNCGNPTWFEFEMNDDVKMEIILNEKAKYIETQELFELKYSDSRDDYKSDWAFANFRELKGGNIKEEYFYRSCSPCDNLHMRAAFADNLIKKYHINCVLNLSNSEKKYASFLEKDDFKSYYYDSLYKDNNVLLLLLNVNYRSQDFKVKLVNGLIEMMKREGPVLVHCAEGKDRTGFVCALILALAGANYKDIIDDYMLTYDNYYNITKDNNPKKYDAIIENIYDFLYCLGEDKTKNLEEINLKEGAISFLKKGDMSDADIERLIKYIIKN